MVSLLYPVERNLKAVAVALNKPLRWASSPPRPSQSPLMVPTSVLGRLSVLPVVMALRHADKDQRQHQSHVRRLG